MRFNDLLRTVLANHGNGLASAVTRWRQCIDLVAQYDVSGATPAYRLTEEEAGAVFSVLTELRARLGAEQRVASIVDLGSRLRSIRLCRFLAQDHPAVVSAVMARARLVDADWAAIIPALGPLARSILRRRPDMGPEALAVLNRFGPTDLALPGVVPPIHELRPANDAAPAPTALDAEERSEIRKIVERIERFTSEREQAGEKPLELDMNQVVQPEPAVIDRFTFEIDEKGRFVDAQGAPRIAVAGLGIGHPAPDALSGADGQALGAFRRRAAFRDARFAIADGVLAGQWRISGDPRFDPATGTFLGYAGTARREVPHEQIVKSRAEAPDRGGLSAAGARQLIHELRTPLSAIHAYAEMIESQLVGPVSSDYRELAHRIVADARTLVATFDDLELAGRIARGEDRRTPVPVDLAALVRGLARNCGHEANLEIADEPFMAFGDKEQMDRMFGHLIRANCAALAVDESLIVRLRALPMTGTLSVLIHRPRALRNLSEAALFDQSSTIDETLVDGPSLGLAFTLRLIRGIAGRAGGQFLLSPEGFELLLPAASESGSSQEHGL